MTFATPQHPRWELQFLINFGVIWGRLFCDIFKRWFQQPDFVMLISSFGQFSCPLISLTSGWVDRSHIQELIICRKPLETSRDWILQAPGQSLGDQKCRCITVNGKTSSGNFKMVDCFILFCSSSLRWPIPVIQTIMLLIQTICLELQRHLISTSESIQVVQTRLVWSSFFTHSSTDLEEQTPLPLNAMPTPLIFEGREITGLLPTTTPGRRIWRLLGDGPISVHFPLTTAGISICGPPSTEKHF